MTMDHAIEQLARVLGAEKARTLVADAMVGAGVAAVNTPQDLLRVSDQLARNGGFAEVVARTLKVQAILQGARLDPHSIEPPGPAPRR